VKHLIISREYPPAPSGGIGTYVLHLSRLLAESGETVHVIGQLWAGAEKEVEEKYDGRLIVHRVPLDDWTSMRGRKPSPAIKSPEAKSLYLSDFYPQCFSWQAGLLAEKLVEREGVDVIEAQEFEAPLYYFQIRRALGLGPKRCPPCIVHLHSPMEFIARYNDWEIGQPYLLTAKRLEDYSIASADALLCPSQYLAHQAEAHYGLPEGAIRVIPHPLGNTPVLNREAETWRKGTLCYVGRLERRKGVIEWLEAAVSVAPEYPDAEFEFVGADVVGHNGISTEVFMRGLIPRDLRPRFRFRGEQKQASLTKFLSKARMAAVPSRWENFPYVCVEAMSSGLPVLASREGGMAEMIIDGRSGWLSPNARSDGLAATLRRALETPPASLAEMGHHASADIRRMCDNESILENHLRFCDQLAGDGARRSLRLAANLPWPQRPLCTAKLKRRPNDESKEGIAIVVTSSNPGVSLTESLQCLRQQTLRPAAVAVVHHGYPNNCTLEYLDDVQRGGWQIISKGKKEAGAAKNSGVEAILSAGVNPRGFAFLDEGDTLQASFVATCESVLQKLPEVGLVSCWIYHTQREQKSFISPCPSFPYQWLSNDSVPFSVVRTEALMEAGKFRPSFSQGFENWDLFNAVMAAGWVAVTTPKILGHHHASKNSRGFVTPSSSYWTMRRELFERFSTEIGREAKEIFLLAESYTVHSLWGDIFALRKKLLLARVLLTNPVRTAAAVAGRIKYKLSRRIPNRVREFISRNLLPKNG